MPANHWRWGTLKDLLVDKGQQKSQARQITLALYLIAIKFCDLLTVIDYSEI